MHVKVLSGSQVRFILMVIKGELVVAKRKREELIEDLKGWDGHMGAGWKMRLLNR